MKKITTTAGAHKEKLKAKRQRGMVAGLPDRAPGRNLMDSLLADEREAAATGFLALPETPERGSGNELVPPASYELEGIAEAVKRPDRVSLQASIQRVSLADQCGAFDLAFDAAESIQAQNATEQMLAHQMAAAHKAAMDLLAKSASLSDTIEMTRLANTASKLMDTYQKAMLTLNRIRTGGQQVVTVQHVQVSDGGQAIINGSLRAPARAGEPGHGI